MAISNRLCDFGCIQTRIATQLRPRSSRRSAQKDGPMPAHNIEAVLLDVGGVLVMPSTDLIRDVLTEHGLEADDERLDRTAYRALQAFDGTQGDDEVLEAAFVATYLTELGLEQSDVSLAKMRSALFIPMWPVRPLGDGRKWLSVLGKSGVPIVVVSNATVAVEEWLRNEGSVRWGPGKAPRLPRSLPLRERALPSPIHEYSISRWRSSGRRPKTQYMSETVCGPTLGALRAPGYDRFTSIPTASVRTTITRMSVPLRKSSSWCAGRVGRNGRRPA
jgi:hypothetical protein